jgi:hypothetical protein
MEKACSRCKEVKSIELFSVDYAAPSGYKSSCKTCVAEYAKNRARRLKAEAIALNPQLGLKPPRERPTSSQEYREIYKTQSLMSMLNQTDVIVPELKYPSVDNSGFVLSDPAYRMYCAARARAKAAELPFDLTIGWIEYNTPDVCPVLGLKLEVATGGIPQANSPSLDKLIPHLGYVKSNCRVISFRANTLKNNASIEEVKAVLAYMERELAAS